LIDPLNGERTKVAVNELSYLRHTYAMAFSWKGPGREPPVSFRAAMADTESFSSVFWKCSTGSTKDQCDFRNVGTLLDESLDLVEPMNIVAAD